MNINYFLAHELWTTLSGDGRKGSFILRTSEQKILDLNIFSAEDDAYVINVPKLVDPNSKMKKNIAPGERATMAYLHVMINQAKFIQSGDILIIDGEGALATPTIREYCEQRDIYLFVLPSIVHQLLNPCDNTFHSLFKRSYYRTISNLNDGAISLEKKFNMAMECYFNIGDEIVEGMFERCGLINSGKNKRALVTGLVCEGITSLEKHDQYHKKCLLSFLKWARANDFASFLCPYSFKFS